MTARLWCGTDSRGIGRLMGLLTLRRIEQGMVPILRSLIFIPRNCPDRFQYLRLRRELRGNLSQLEILL